MVRDVRRHGDGRREAARSVAGELGFGAGGALTFSHTNNTFTGTLQTYSPGNGSLPLTVNSLPDSANPIRLNGSANPGLFALGAGVATPLLFDNRHIELYGSGGGAIENNNAEGYLRSLQRTGIFLIVR